MTYFFVIQELCLQLDSTDTIRNILRTAVDESMLTVGEAEVIANECHLDE
jgi:hypothetical protein